LIKDGQFVLDERDDWSEHQPSTEQENRFIQEHGIAEMGNGIWESMMRKTKTPRPAISSHMETSKRFIDAVCLPPSRGLLNTNTRI
jgi:hypothetical protein